MTDPLTYLDEVDARAERYPEVEPPYLVYMPGEWIGVGNDDDRVSWAFDAGVAWAEHRDRADLLALSKALRAVLSRHAPVEVGCPHPTHKCNDPDYYGLLCPDAGPECEAGCGWWPCIDVQAIQAALAVNDEGGK